MRSEGHVWFPRPDGADRPSGPQLRYGPTNAFSAIRATNGTNSTVPTNRTKKSGDRLVRASTEALTRTGHPTPSSHTVVLPMSAAESSHVTPALDNQRLYPAPRRHAEALVPANNDVVKQANIHQRQGLLQPCRHRPVRRRWFDLTRRVVVGDDHRRGVLA